MGGQTQIAAVLSLVGSIIVFVLILFLAYLFTRFVGGRYLLKGTKGGSVEILERVPLGTDKALLVVRAAGRVLLIGMTPHHIENLGELDAGQYAAPETKPGETAPAFSAALQSALESWGHKKKQEKDQQDE